MTVDIASLLIPLLLTAAALWALGRRVDVYDALTAGASEGLTVLLRIVPSLIALLTAVYMFRASGALAVGSELMAAHGPDSYIGRVAAVMLGSSETTFYTIAVYFGSVGIVKTRYTIPASLCADAVMFLTSAAAVRVLMG